MKEKIINLIAYQADIKPQEISLSDTLDQLGMDSLDNIELIMKLEETFGIEISDEEADKIKTVSDVVKYVENKTAISTH